MIADVLVANQLKFSYRFTGFFRPTEGHSMPFIDTYMMPRLSDNGVYKKGNHISEILVVFVSNPLYF